MYIYNTLYIKECFLYCLGLDLMDMGDVMPTGKDVARNCFKIRPKIEEYQESFTSIEKVCKTHAKFT